MTTLDDALQRLADLTRDGRLPSAALVGGAVRDALLGRPVREADIAVAGDLEAAAREVEVALGVRVAYIPGEYPIARLAVDGGPIDLVPLRGTLDADLALRDFTINALAVPLERLPPAGLAALTRDAVVDHHGGLADLDARTVRLVSPRALDDDPVRALRAARIACRLEFALAPDTARRLPVARDGLARVAPERIGAELRATFEARHAARGVRMLDDAGLLTFCFPELEEGRGLEQRPHHIYAVLDHALAAAEWMDVLLLPDPPPDPRQAEAWRGVWSEQWPTTRWGPLRPHLDRHAMTLRLATLLHDVAKPRTLTVDEAGHTRFFGHAELGAGIARAALRRWRFPNAEVHRVALLVEQHLRPGQVASPGRPPTERALYSFHKALGDATPDVCFLFLADSLATAGPDALLPRWRAYVAHVRRIITWLPPVPPEGAPRLVTGHDIMLAAGLPPGPAVGRILAAIEEAAATGEVTTRDEALALARTLAAESPLSPGGGEVTRG